MTKLVIVCYNKFMENQKKPCGCVEVLGPEDLCEVCQKEYIVYLEEQAKIAMQQEIYEQDYTRQTS